GATGGGANGGGSGGAGGWSSGTWSQAATVTLHGSGFGTRASFGPAGSPLMIRAWDGCELDDPLLVWSEAGPSAAAVVSANYAMKCRTPAEVTALKSSGTAPGTATLRDTRYLSAAASASTAFAP